MCHSNHNLPHESCERVLLHGIRSIPQIVNNCPEPSKRLVMADAKCDPPTKVSTLRAPPCDARSYFYTNRFADKPCKLHSGELAVTTYAEDVQSRMN